MKWLSELARSITRGVGRLFAGAGEKRKPRKRNDYPRGVRDPDFDRKLRRRARFHKM